MCGIVGIIGSPDAAREAFLALTTLQHRGQDGAGILTVDSDGFHSVKNLGLVESIFTRENMRSLTGGLCVGHTRYATSGRGDLGEVQPFLLTYPYGLGLVHNGNVVNKEVLASELRRAHRRSLSTRSDSEVVLNWLAVGLSQPSGGSLFDQICEAVAGIHARANGSYSICTLIADQGLLIFRDPLGLRPLVLGRKSVTARGPGSLPTGEAWMAASESVALGFNGYDVVGEVAPGEVVFVDLAGVVHRRVLASAEKKPHRPCMFEWVYFASPESTMDGIPVYGSRIQLGKKLSGLVRERLAAKGVTPDMVVPVPETSRISGVALAEELGIPYREVLIKNRYIKRTFILDSQDKRESAVNLKLSPVKSEIQGKKILLVDDSIVRGTTSKRLIELVRRAGAKEVYFVSTCPPIRHPCYYGIDFPSGKELIAHERELAEIERELGADAVIYLDLAGLRRALLDAVTKADSNLQFCMACLDGQYPTDVAVGKSFADARERERGGHA